MTRTGYGAEGKPSLHPLDSALNLPAEKYSLEVRRRVAIEAAKGAFEEGVKALEGVYRRTRSQAAMRRTGDPCGAGL